MNTKILLSFAVFLSLNLAALASTPVAPFQSKGGIILPPGTTISGSGGGLTNVNAGSLTGQVSATLVGDVSSLTNYFPIGSAKALGSATSYSADAGTFNLGLGDNYIHWSPAGGFELNASAPKGFTFWSPATFFGSIAGNGTGLTNLNASSLASGTVPTNNLPGALPQLSTGNGARLTNGVPGIDLAHARFFVLGDSESADMDNNGFANSWVYWLTNTPRYRGVWTTNMAYGGWGVTDVFLIALTNAVPLMQSRGVGTQDVAFVWEGQNDADQNVLASWWPCYTNLVWMLRTNGALVCTMTVLPRTGNRSAWAATNVFTMNTAIRTNVGMWDYMVDNYSQFPNNYNMVDYRDDHSHLTTNAWARVAQQVDVALRVGRGNQVYFGQRAGWNQNGTNFWLQNDLGYACASVDDIGNMACAGQFSSRGSLASYGTISTVNGGVNFLDDGGGISYVQADRTDGVSFHVRASPSFGYQTSLTLSTNGGAVLLGALAANTGAVFGVVTNAGAVWFVTNGVPNATITPGKLGDLLSSTAGAAGLYKWKGSGWVEIATAP